MQYKKAAEGHEYFSTKTYDHSVGLSCCFRQWKAESHCRFLHGYAIKVQFKFGTNELDVRNWVVDFGSLKSLRGWLEDMFDHKTIVAEDDPELGTFQTLEQRGLLQLVQVSATGCEAMARIIFEASEVWLKDNGYTPRVYLKSVEVSEHTGNSAIYQVKP